MRLELEGFDHLTVEVGPALNGEYVEEIWSLYDAAFKRIAHHNPCRQHLHRDEFDSAIKHSEYTVLIGRDESGPGFFCLLTDNFGLVPWIAPEFYDSRFPETVGKRVYIGAIFVRIDKQGAGYFRPMMLAIQRYMEDRGLIYCFFDHGGEGPNKMLADMIVATPRTAGKTIGTQVYDVAQTFPDERSDPARGLT